MYWSTEPALDRLSCSYFIIIFSVIHHFNEFLMITVSLSQAVKHCMSKLGAFNAGLGKSHFSVVVLTGLAGSGKTTIAANFAKSLDLDPIGLRFTATVVHGDDYAYDTGLKDELGLAKWEVKIHELTSSIWSTPVLIDCTADNLNSLLLLLLLHFGRENIHVVELDTPLQALKNAYWRRLNSGKKTPEVNEQFKAIYSLSTKKLAAYKKAYSTKLHSALRTWDISSSTIRVNRKLPNGYNHELADSDFDSGFASNYDWFKKFEEPENPAVG